jgi:AcrR family transcriptional regulator
LWEAERRAIARALIDLAAEHGYRGTTIEMVLVNAGVDREAFERHFRSKVDCFAAVWEEITEECLQGLSETLESEQGWADGLRAIAYEAARAAASDPNCAIFAIETLSAGSAARARRDMVLRALAAAIDAGREEMNDPDLISRTTAEALAGSTYCQFQAKLVAGAHSELLSLVPQLVASVVLPYLGREAALAEIEQCVPTDQPTEEPATGDPAGLPEETSPVETPEAFGSQGTRERLMLGLAFAVRRYGYGGATINRIASAATLSTQTFYRYFTSKAACVDAACDAVMRELRDRIELAFDAKGRWPNGLPAAILAMLRFFASEPALAHLCLVEAPAVDGIGARRYQRTIETLAPFFGAAESSAFETPDAGGRSLSSPTVEEALAGGVVSVISQHVMSGEVDSLEALLPDLAVFALAPFVGTAEARWLATA